MPVTFLFSSLRLFFLFLYFNFICLEYSHATIDISRYTVLGGFGMSSSTSSNSDKTVRSEGPLAFSFTIDHSYQGAFFLMAEHMRTLDGASTAVGLTGAGVKYYPWLSPLHFKSKNQESLVSNVLHYTGYAFYFGGSSGFAQASVPAKGDKLGSIAAGLYINGKAGVDYTLTQRWGLRSEFNYAMTILGAGQIQQLNLLVGIYLDL